MNRSAAKARSEAHSEYDAAALIASRALRDHGRDSQQYKTASAVAYLALQGLKAHIAANPNPKRKPGRPPLPEGEARTVKVLVALTPDEATASQARATRAGKTLAGWARDVLVRAARR